MRAHAGGEEGWGEPALTSSRPMGPMSPNGYAMTQTPLNPYTPNEPKWLRKTTRSSPLNSPTIHFSTAAVVPLAQGGRGNHSPPTVSSTPSACLTASTATTATPVAPQLLGSKLKRPLLLDGLHCDPVSLELLGSQIALRLLTTLCQHHLEPGCAACHSPSCGHRLEGWTLLHSLQHELLVALQLLGRPAEAASNSVS
jgi:hypothetical protein